ncbi:MAG: signal peptidase I [Candidatus Levybacteria bacterium RIFCSPLOWO2_01_FULL_38_21]|nr:MAG: signal peptidase I [Candidatus Levybacteria bacterium RIFCSPLOWO2_01_FULL_38_21]
MSIVRKIYTFLIDIVETLLLAAAVFLVIYVFLFRPFQVNGDSMYPNFTDREYILTNIIVLSFEKPKKSEVIVFKAPPEPEKDFIKRVIATSGDKIYIKNGSVFLNGEKLDESSYLQPNVKTYGGSFLKEGQEVKVPEESYLVMGDNRSYSSDSREWGFVSRKSIIGKSFFVYWPLNKIGFVKIP